jgi:hypothetical protein
MKTIFCPFAALLLVSAVTARRPAEFGPRIGVRSCLKRAWAACTIATTELPNN